MKANISLRNVKCTFVVCGKKCRAVYIFGSKLLKTVDNAVIVFLSLNILSLFCN